MYQGEFLFIASLENVWDYYSSLRKFVSDRFTHDWRQSGLCNGSYKFCFMLQTLV